MFLASLSLEAQETRILKAESGVATSKHDMFGWQVQHNEEYIFSSAPHQDTTGRRNTGSVFIYRVNGKQVTFTQRLYMPGAPVNAMFGSSMAHSGAYLAVASQFPIQGKGASGFINIFRNVSGKWNLVSTIPATPADNAPTSMAIDGNTLVAGYSLVDGVEKNGYVNIYTIDPATDQVSLQQKITVSGLKMFDLIGHQVAIHKGVLAFSSLAADGIASHSGSVWIYRNINNSWTFMTQIEHESGGSYDHFGYSLAIDYPWIAVGAPRQLSAEGKRSGAVYVFSLAANSYALEAKLESQGSLSEYDYFGSSVDIHNKMLTIGAHADDFAGHNTGAVYIYKRNANSWQQINKIIGSQVNSNASFGSSVSLFNGTLLSSSHLEESDTALTDHGAIYFYPDASTPLALQKSKDKNTTLSSSAYPNPASESFRVQLSKEEQLNAIEVFDINGKLVYRNENPSAAEIEINCRNWANGIYVVSIHYESRTENLQVLKK